MINCQHIFLQQSRLSSEDDMDIVDPLRHLDISSDLTKCSVSSEESLAGYSTTTMASAIPEHLPANIGKFLLS